MALISKEGISLSDFAGNVLEREVSSSIDWDAEAAEGAAMSTICLKEIYEQPNVLQQTLGVVWRAMAVMSASTLPPLTPRALTGSSSPLRGLVMQVWLVNT
ncbi:MAG: hypothetical protein R2865_00055 [Deinococcales bacterium]